MFRLAILFILIGLPFAARAETAVIVPPDLVDKADIDSFYALRDGHTAWGLNTDDAQKRTLAFLDSVDALVAYHGLDAKHYPTALMRKLAASHADTDHDQLEILITASLLRLAHDLHGDSIDLSELYTGWNFHRSPTDIPAQLNMAATEGKLENLFENIAPQQTAYRDLAKALQQYRAIESKGGWKQVDFGPSLRPNDRNPRVTQLRARLQAEGYTANAPPEGADFFDENLRQALVAYQTRNGLDTDGHAGAKTQQALNIPVAARIDQIRANMERWRHMPDEFPPPRYVIVNIPDFTVDIRQDGVEPYHGLVVVGRTDRPTPFVHSAIRSMIVNPAWHVPVKIARKDILPKLRHDPHYLEKLNIVIANHADDPYGEDIDWASMPPNRFNFTLRQAPGDINSLGRLKFDFTNPFDVYMHGTPHQELFEKSERDFSSGCIRLRDPDQVAEILLSHNHDEDGDWNQQRITEEIDAAKTKWVGIAKPIPIYVLYWSVFADDNGMINFRKDIYNYDASLIEKMQNAP